MTWIVLLLLAPLSYFAAAWGVWLLRDLPDLAAVMLLLILAAFAAPVVLLFFSVKHMMRTYRQSRRVKGKYTPAERLVLAQQADAAQHWESARALRASLLRKEIPPSISQYAIVLRPGEIVFAHVNAQYARYYGRDVSYATTGGFAFGRPAFVMGALAVTAIANSSARLRAQAEAAPQWREWQQTTVFVTNQRLVAFSYGQWLSFPFNSMTAVYPEVSSWALVCQLEQGEPLLLNGLETPIAALHTVLGTHGLDAVGDHPSLRVLEQPASEPALAPLGRAKTAH